MAFVMAAIGSAVGLGNVWKFPYMVSEYGGGLFIITYLACIVIIGLPILISEINLGYIGDANPVNSIRRLAQGRPGGAWWSFIGYSGIVAAFLILSFYMVICGWVCSYLFNIAALAKNPDPTTINEAFERLSSDQNRQFFWHSLMVWSTALIMSGGIRETIEKVFSLLMPLLAFLMIGLLVYALYSGYAFDALTHMFTIDASKLEGSGSIDIIIAAMGQAFFTLSVGMGAIMVFGSYLPRGSSVTRAACVIALADTLIALAAAVIVFSLVLQQGMDIAGGGPGLVFKTLPLVFAQIPGGPMIGSIFFFVLLLAAISSAMSLFEPVICYFSERLSIKRSQVALTLGFFVWLLGIPTILSFTQGFSILPGERTWFETVDFVSSQLLLPIGGILIALFSSWVIASRLSAASLKMSPGIFKVFLCLLRTITPLAILVTLGGLIVAAL